LQPIFGLKMSKYLSRQSFTYDQKPQPAQIHARENQKERYPKKVRVANKRGTSQHILVAKYVKTERSLQTQRNLIGKHKKN